VGFIGFLQPLLDVLKLFRKGINIPIKAELILFFGPTLRVFLIIFFWGFFPSSLDSVSPKIFLGVVLAVSSISGLSLIISG